MKFPAYLFNSFGAERCRLTFEDKDQETLFIILFKADQILDQIKALKFAEDFLSTKDLRTMSVPELIQFLRDIQRISSDALMASFALPAGNFITSPVLIRQETGIKDTQFDDPIYSERNKQILEKIHGVEVAKQYESFAKGIASRIKAKTYNDVNDVLVAIQSHADDPRLAAFQKVTRIINPLTIAEKIRKIFTELKQKISNHSDPIDCAAYILYQLVTCHAFPHGNRRTARIFMNSLLLAMKHPAILIPKQDVANYYLAIEQSSEDNLTPIKKLLTQYAEQSRSQKQEPMFDQKGWSDFIMTNEDPDQTIILFPDHYLASANNRNFIKHDGNQYLEYAKKFETNLTAAYYFSHRAMHFYQSAKDNDGNDGFEKAKKANSKYRNKIAELTAEKIIIDVAPCETARVDINRNKHTFLHAKLSSPYLGILLKDKHGNISLTHADDRTDFGFIKREAATMQGEFTLDVVIKDMQEANIPNNTPNIYLKAVSKFIASHFPNIKNSKGNNDTRKTKTGSILITEGKILVAEEKFINELRPESINRGIAPNNPLKTYTLQEGTKSSQLRLLERIFSIQLTKELTQPTIIYNYNNGWTNTFPSLNTELLNIMNQMRDMDEQARYVYLSRIFARWGDISLPNNQQVIKNLLSGFDQYFLLEKNNLYTQTSSSFFKAKIDMPDKVLGLIVDYATSNRPDPDLEKLNTSASASGTM